MALKRDSMDWIMEEACGLLEASGILAKCKAIRGRSTMDVVKVNLLRRWDVVRKAHTHAKAGTLGVRAGVAALLAMIDMTRLANRMNEATFDHERTDHEVAVADAVIWRADKWANFLRDHRTHDALMNDVIRRLDDDSVTDSPSVRRTLLTLLADAKRWSVALDTNVDADDPDRLEREANTAAIEDLMLLLNREGDRVYSTHYALDDGRIRYLAIWRLGNEALEFASYDPPYPGESKALLRTMPLNEVASEIAAEGRLVAASGGRLVACAACRGAAWVHAGGLETTHLDAAGETMAAA